MNRDEALKKANEGIAALHEALAEGKSEQLEQYLKTMSRFHSYSFGNVMLILTQMTVTQCDTFRGLRFKREFLLIW